MRNSVGTIASLAVLPILHVAGCGTSKAGTTAALDGGGAVADLPVWVVEPVPTDLRTFMPVAGAKVVVDQSGAPRREVVAGPDGKAVVTGIDWSAGDAVVTAYAPGHVIASLVRVNPDRIASGGARFYDPAGSDLVFRLNPLGPASASDYVTITGSLRNKLDPADVVNVAARSAEQSVTSAGPTYSIVVPKNRAVTILALEWAASASQPANGYEEAKHRWVEIAEPAVGADTTLDIDLGAATPLTIAKSNLKLVKPVGGASAKPTWLMQTDESPAYVLGSTTRMTPSADGTYYDLVAEYVTPSDLNGLHPYGYYLFPGVNGESFTAFIDGPPVEGASVEFFAAPESTISSIALGGSIPLQGIDPKTELVGFHVVNHPLAEGVDTPVWFIETLRGVVPGELTVPTLPDEAKAMLPVGAAVQGRVLVSGGKRANPPYFTSQVTYGKFVSLSQ